MAFRLTTIIFQIFF